VEIGNCLATPLHWRSLLAHKSHATPSKLTGEWNTMEITLDGPHTVVLVNRVKVTDYIEGQPVLPQKARV